MAESKYEYVKQYQSSSLALPNCYILVRLDGRAFTKLCIRYKLDKPCDLRLLRLMNQAALSVMKQFTDIFIAYGQSDQYSFAINKKSQFYGRRIDKIGSTLVSYFTASFMFLWPRFFDITIQQPVCFDSRVVVYPGERQLIDYFKWRQVDCHINNLYNTCFWHLVKKQKMKNSEAEGVLSKTNSAGKNEILFQAGINYNNEAQINRRGSIIISKKKQKPRLAIYHSDMLKDSFWSQILYKKKLEDTCSQTDFQDSF